jgi:endonuclease YncB( thermonuclease family)
MRSLPKAGPSRILLGAFLASIILNVFLLTKGNSGDNGVPVIGVVDGDTLVLDGKTRVRLRYADAPELEFCGGNEAKSLLESLVVGKNVRITEQIPDQYGRAMALVYEGNTLVNLQMLDSGWVRYHHDVTKLTEELKTVADEAKGNGRGIFGLCQSKKNAKKPSCIIKGNIDKANDAKRYYVPGCAQYAFTIVEEDVGEQWFCTEAEARKAGYVKAETCR